MATLLLVLLWVILGLLLLILAIAAAPVILRAQLQTSPRVRFQLQISPLGGLIPFLTIVGGQSAKQNGEDRAKVDKKPPAKGKKGSSSQAWEPMLRNFPRLVGDVLRQFEFRMLVVDARFGLGDPADTGAVFGALCPIIYGAPPARRFSINVVPDYGRPCFDGQIEATGAITPLRLILPFARFSWRSFSPSRAG